MSSQNNRDEIDDIMNEIEALQRSMVASQDTGSETAAPEAHEPVAAPAPEPEPSLDMAEFRGSSDDVSMEETLSNLKDDASSGPNLIDQAIEAENQAAHEDVEPELADEAVVEAEEDELLDEAEAEALDDAVAEAEKAAIAAAAEVEAAEAVEVAEVSEVPQPEIQEVVMSEAPRRERNAHPPSMSLKLTGDILMRLSCEFEGQEVLIGFEDGTLRIEMSDGTEFKIPVRRAVRKAA